MQHVNMIELVTKNSARAPAEMAVVLVKPDVAVVLVKPNKTPEYLGERNATLHAIMERIESQEDCKGAC